MKKIIACFITLVSLCHAATDPQVPPSKAAMCSACHGMQGISTNPEWPNLAAQHATYLQKQLQAFKLAKNRNDAIMTPLVSSLSDEDMAELALFYAKQTATPTSIPMSALARGRELYLTGDRKARIPACITCHGPQGTGNEQAGFPYIAGQHAAYTLKQLERFKNKERTTDINGIMQDIAARMTQKDMEAVARYIEAL